MVRTRIWKEYKDEHLITTFFASRSSNIYALSYRCVDCLISIFCMAAGPLIKDSFVLNSYHGTFLVNL